MKLFTILILAFFFIGAIMQDSVREAVDLSRFSESINMMRAVMTVDDERRMAIRKVRGILNEHNPKLSPRTKQDIADEIYEMSKKYPNLDLDLICATITHESGRTWEPRVISRAGALGLMQIMPSTGKWLAKYEAITWTSAEEILFNPIYNIRMGSRYLSALIETYDLEGGLAAYNGGSTRAERWLAHNKAEGILWAETTQYIPFVLKIYEKYRRSTL